MAGAFLGADLATMLSQAEFAVSATLNASPIIGIFDSDYVDPLGTVSNSPVLVCASASVSAATRGSVVVVGAVTYAVRDIQPDGTGVTVLILERS